MDIERATDPKDIAHAITSLIQTHMKRASFEYASATIDANGNRQILLASRMANGARIARMTLYPSQIFVHFRTTSYSEGRSPIRIDKRFTFHAVPYRLLHQVAASHSLTLPRLSRSETR